MGVWNEENQARLKELWQEGHSASTIAVQLGGGISKNAVIGKIHRLGLSKLRRPKRAASPRKIATVDRTSTPKPSARRSATISLAPVSSVLRPARPDPDFQLPPTEYFGAFAISGIKDQNSCRFTVGEVKDPDFRFCGAKTRNGSRYCDHHHSIVYLPSKTASGRAAAAL